MKRTAAASLLAIACLCLPRSVLADYTEVRESQSVEVDRIYANEWGSPLIRFKEVVNPACAYGGTGLYLYNIEIQQPGESTWTLRSNKLSLILLAKATKTRVVLHYFYDQSVPGWAACYIHGVDLLD